MDRNIKTKLANLLHEHFVKRKAMFIPIACVSTFMLVGYVAIDKEKPEIISSQITLPYGEAFETDAIDITDNQSTRDLIDVQVNTETLDVNQLGTYQVEVMATDQFSNSAIKTIDVDVVDQHGPKFVALGSNEGYVIQVPVKGSTDFASYIKATDNVDGDVTPFIESDVALDTSKTGFQTITLTATDSSNNVSKQTYEFAILDIEAPIIQFVQGEQATLDYQSVFKVEDIVRVSDNLDEVPEVTVEGSVDTQKMDEAQPVKVIAKDSSGNLSEATVQVVIKDLSAPTITLSKEKITVDAGTNVDGKEYLVSAVDTKDGNITADVSVSVVNTESAGTKTITYSVSDNAGNTTNATLSVVVNPVYSNSSSIIGGSAVQYAKSRVGMAYVFGASGPTAFDCSGLTSWAFKQAGKTIPRTTGGQASGGTYVPKNELQPGDLLFYSQGGGAISHVGMYVGGGRMVHASTPKTGVCYSSINIMTYVTARRY